MTEKQEAALSREELLRWLESKIINNPPELSYPLSQSTKDAIAMQKRYRSIISYLSPNESAKKSSNEELIEQVAKAIAEQGIGRTWPDDFRENAVDDFDQNDIREYARVALEALATTRTPAVPQISEETIKAALTAFRHEEDVMGGSGGAAMRAALTASTGTASQWRGKAIPSMDVERRLRFAFMEGFAAGVENPDDLGNEEEMGFAYTASDTQAYIDHGEAGYPDPSLATPPTAAQVKGE